jgi:hypothetical protein
MAVEIIRGFKGLNTAKNPKHLDLSLLAYALNTEYKSDEEIAIRRGCLNRKNNVQWAGATVIDGVTFKKRSDATYKEIVFLNNGKIYYIDSANYVDNTSTYTELLSPTGTSPALAINGRVSFDAINNVFYVVDGSSNIYSWDGAAANLSLVADPTEFTITFTVLLAATADIDAIYSQGSSKFIVKATKASGTGTTLTLRQTQGNARPTATGTLTKDSGGGDASIAYTAVAYSHTYEEYKLFQRKAMVVSNEGVIFGSINRVGSNFTGSGSGTLEFDVIEGLKVSNFISLKNTALVTTEDSVTEKFSISSLSGFKFLAPGEEVGAFRAERESKIHGIVGRSGQEIGNVVIGLTRNGFVMFSGTTSTEVGFTDQESVSSPIRDQIRKINFSKSNKIVSVVDTINQRYICAVPTGASEECNTLLVYDYGKSTDIYKWSIWSLGFGVVTGLFLLKNKVYVADAFGKYHELCVDNIYTDDGIGYTTRIEFANIGGNTSVRNKQYKSIFVDFTIPDREQTVKMYTKLDGYIINYAPGNHQIKEIDLTPKRGSGSLINDSTFIDNNTFIGSDAIREKQIKHDHLGGQGLGCQVGIINNGPGNNWSITGMMLEYEDSGKARAG